ncbi:MAG: hypothetical protein KY476_17230 [Planctomycetes bacterium]|nr:hypothetical protein [Planctomycetota bacterium]
MIPTDAQATSQFVRDRVDSLARQIPAHCRGRITMGVAVAESSDGSRVVLIGTSEPRGYVRPGVVLEPDEILVAGYHHAEQDVVDFAAANDLQLLDIGATRPICPACAAAIAATAAHISTPLKTP